MRLLMIGDIHGKLPRIKDKDFDSILCCGDLCEFTKVRNIIFSLARQGIDMDWYDFIGRRKAQKLVKKAIESGKKVLKQLAAFKKPIYIIPGNVDFYEKDSYWNYLNKNHYERIIKGFKNVVDCHMKLVDAGDFFIIGYGNTSAPEMIIPSDEEGDVYDADARYVNRSYNRKFKKLSSIFKRATNRKKKKPIVFLSHNVPFATKLDKIKNISSPMHGQNFGSILARHMIETYNPLLCIGGHIHEGFGKDKIADTICINSGGAYEGKKVYAKLELFKKEWKIRAIKMIRK